MTEKRFHALGIRRIVAGTLVVIWMGVNALGILYISREHELIEETVLTITAEHGRSWAHRCAGSMLAARPGEVQEIVDALKTEMVIERAWVEDAEGKTIADSDSEHARTASHDEQSFSVEEGVQVVEKGPHPEGFFHTSGHDFELEFLIDDGGERLGTLGIEINTAWANQRAKELGMKGLGALLFVTAAFAAVAFWVDRRLLRAVQQLDCAVREIARGRFDQVVQLTTGDELAELGASVNLMAEGLRRSERRVASWKTRLEQTVTDRTQQLEESQALLAHREKMAALGLMAAGIAHEVGNPLAAISAIIQRIEWDAEPHLRDKCQTVRQQILRISTTIDELRQFARPAQSRSQAPIAINEIICLALQICRYDPRAKKIEVEIDLSPDLPCVRGDVDRWQQVFLNIIFNAFDAMPAGGTLTAISRCRDGDVELVFRDTGTGISPEQVGRLFHPFYTTKSPERGSGLGLAVCQGIVRSFGGEIEVESKLGQGAEFRIRVSTGSSRTAKGDSVRRAGPPAQTTPSMARQGPLPISWHDTGSES